MILLLLFLHIHLIHSTIRIGHLNSHGVEETKILHICAEQQGLSIFSAPACDSFIGLDSASELHHNHNVQYLIGVDCDEESQTIARLAVLWDRPYISPSHASTKNKENTTISIQPIHSFGIAGAFTALCEYFGWLKIGVLYSGEKQKRAVEVIHELENSQTLNLTVEVEMNEYHSIERIIANCRVIFCIGDVSTVRWLLRNLLQNAERPFEFIIVFIADKRIVASDFFFQVNQEIQLFDGKDLKRSESFVDNILLLQSMHPNEAKIAKFAADHKMENNEVLHSSLLLCDGIELIKHIDLAKEGGNSSLREGKLFTDLQLACLSFLEDAQAWQRQVGPVFEPCKSYSGPLFFTHLGQRLPFFSVYSQIEHSIIEIGQIQPTENKNDNISAESIHTFKPHSLISSVIPRLPPYLPSCGYAGEFCNRSNIFVIALIVLSILTVPLGIAFHLQRKERKLLQMPWRIKFEELKLNPEEGPPAGYHRVSTAGSLTDSEGSDETKKYGYINGNKVYIHSIVQKKAINFERAEMATLNQLKYLSHANVNLFHGLAFNFSTEFLILWSFCVRGSLDDVIFSSQRFGRNFQSTFIKHILNGLQFIHSSPIKFHGSLFLSNCLVDSYWVVKLSDFGLQDILKNKSEQKDIALTTYKTWEYVPRKYVQLSPEALEFFLESRDFSSTPKSQEGDIYQLGMCLYQIIFRMRPFRERKEDVKDTMELVCQDATPLRPKVPQSTEFTMRLLSIMQQCWLARPEARPALFKINDAVAREFGHDSKGTLIDQMIKMIDDYSANLEEIVAERTKQLEQANTNMENLLYQMMPKSLACSVLSGEPIRPQRHSSTSVLIADVCQFTLLCESLIPEHLIDVLQELYSSFDKVLTAFEAFKVENVGDCYMLISGVWNLAEGRHLAEVAKIALNLKEVVETFTVPHRPSHKMAVKFGISCGPVATGILGYRAPRFCVFGDTVNMACQMGATGLPNMIQLTEQAAQSIQKNNPEFLAEERGVVHLKGKGPQTTYWLKKDSVKNTTS